MVIECPSCHARYRYDESKLQGSTSKKIKCPRCKGIIEIKRESFAQSDSMDQTFTAIPAAAGAAKEAVVSESPKTQKVKREVLFGDMTGEGSSDRYLNMPEYRKLSLAVIQGNNVGEIFQLNKPKMVIGRGADADIVVRDGEASRHHARIDIMGDRVILRDLNSTNGTFVNEQKVTTVNLENQMEFRIGTTVFMLIITEID